MRGESPGPEGRVNVRREPLIAVETEGFGISGASVVHDHRQSVDGAAEALEDDDQADVLAHRIRKKQTSIMQTKSSHITSSSGRGP